MLTKVILDGPMGKRFGKVWELEIGSPSEALRLIEANKPGLMAWCHEVEEKYVAYKVQCEYEDGRTELLDNDTYAVDRQLKSVRFTPVVAGAGGMGKMLVGAAFIFASFIPGLQAFSPFLLKMGASMMLGGVIEALSPQPKKPSSGSSSSSSSGGGATGSYYFNGPVNTTEQGIPVQLVYGRVLVGSHAVSAFMSVDEV